MRARILAVMCIVAVLSGCAPDGGEKRMDGGTDPAFQAQLDGIANGSIPPPPTTSTGAAGASSSQPPSGSSGRAGVAPALGAYPNVDLACLSARLNALVANGELSQAALATWIRGLGGSGPVQAAAEKLLAAGECAG